jgi:hypothetical protein
MFVGQLDAVLRILRNVRRALQPFSVEKNEKFIADFHVLGLFMTIKHDLSEKKIVCHPPLPLNAKFVPRLQPAPLKARKLKLRLNESFGPT